MEMAPYDNKSIFDRLIQMNLSVGTVGHNRNSNGRSMPFELKFRLSRLRKNTIISDRDELGRIVH